MIEKTFNKIVNKEQNACDTKPDTKIFCQTKVLNLENEKASKNFNFYYFNYSMEHLLNLKILKDS